jgi:hypothetical protein
LSKGTSEETFVARFDPQAGMLRFLEAMRYRDAADEVKILWINKAREWRDINGSTTLTVGAVTWFDEGTADMISGARVRAIVTGAVSAVIGCRSFALPSFVNDECDGSCHVVRL